LPDFAEGLRLFCRVRARTGVNLAGAIPVDYDQHDDWPVSLGVFGPNWRITLMATKTAAYAAQAATTPLAPFSLDRRDPGPRDVHIEILFCGVCHSDLHTARAEWAGVTFPVVPGHEIVGRVTKVGRDVRGFKFGDTAAVGCMVDSCKDCPSCTAGLEQYCEHEIIFTYNSPDQHFPGKMTYGGYSQNIVVDERFALHVGAKANLAAVAPLLCAGITTYSPLKHWQAGPGKKVGIVGLGGLGHMGVKLSHALGAHTVVFTTSPGKTEDAKRLGADEVVISRDENQLKKHVSSFDFILNMVAAPHSLDTYTQLLKVDGTL
jgi:alcohol dehydrogenase (NADP+)